MVMVKYTQNALGSYLRNVIYLYFNVSLLSILTLVFGRFVSTMIMIACFTKHMSMQLFDRKIKITIMKKICFDDIGSDHTVLVTKLLAI